MVTIPNLASLDEGFCRKFDLELQKAHLSLPRFHQVLDEMGATSGDAESTSPGQRLCWLVLEQVNRQRSRVEIGCNFRRHPRWKFLLGIPLIYVPIIVGILPMILCSFLVRTHLTLVGGHKLKSYWKDFVPTWISHRYTLKTQIIPHNLFNYYGRLLVFARSKLFWVFNCKLYCPLSVALLAYVLYLVKIVEQWWCPFDHDRKYSYADVPIDKSFWHAAGDEKLMHPGDRENSNWNRNARSPSLKPNKRD